MSEDERAPYKALADADVVRYQEVRIRGTRKLYLLEAPFILHFNFGFAIGNGCFQCGAGSKQLRKVG